MTNTKKLATILLSIFICTSSLKAIEYKTPIITEEPNIIYSCDAVLDYRILDSIMKKYDDQMGMDPVPNNYMHKNLKKIRYYLLNVINDFRNKKDELVAVQHVKHKVKVATGKRNEKGECVAKYW